MKLGQNILQIFLQRRMRRFNEIQNDFFRVISRIMSTTSVFSRAKEGPDVKVPWGMMRTRREKKETKGHLAPLVKPDKCITRLMVQPE